MAAIFVRVSVFDPPLLPGCVPPAPFTCSSASPGGIDGLTDAFLTRASKLSADTNGRRDSWKFSCNEPSGSESDLMVLLAPVQLRPGFDRR